MCERLAIPRKLRFLYIILLEAPESNKTLNLLLIRRSFLVLIRIAMTVPSEELDISF